MAVMAHCLSFLWLLSASYAGASPFIWPVPLSYSISDTLLISLNNSFEIKTNSSSTLIKNAIQRYNKIIFQHNPESSPSLNASSPNIIVTSVDVTIKDDNDSNLNYGIDESYKLIFPGEGIISNTVWGALRGLETLSQIIIYNFNIGYYQSYIINITDSPRFKWRGLLIDTSGNYLPLNILKTLLDSMSYAKFNTLHWHIVDWASFPYQSKIASKLSHAAYSNSEIYTINDVKEIIEYGQQRGIRIVIEFDMPGHALSWCTGYPEICPNPDCNSPATGQNGHGMLNPAANLTYKIINDLLTEASNIFIDDYIHIGGDETNTSCWDQTPEIVQWEKENNFTDDTALLHLIKYGQNVVNGLGKKAINWVEVFDEYQEYLDSKLITIQVWKAQSALKSVVSAGFNAILSGHDEWYLDYVYNEKGYNVWQTMYSVEPYENITDVKQQELILGGEGCLWEVNIDSSNVENAVWPRAAAIAERLWSPIHVNNITAATPRYAYFRCLLNQRGIQAEPYNMTEPDLPPTGPGSCYTQR